ncbi:hypothetical protein ILUMI_26788 [Ignelater luminosus]|uniref:Uncharacterized protein n=1 Tax=Ignelater luminosus TaxID=2038154 RepID=A0A8K0C7E6_IGNLU|nr:hypothetical protein ILUMI_26788 [Ignelater luminosus]
MYIDFREEYISMGHMSLVETYLTTKLRVVFNGSAPSDNGVSLYDLQYIGPSVQDELISILEIEVLVQDAELNDQIAERNEFEDSYYNVVALYRSILQDNKDGTESICTFKELVHDNRALTNAYKFHYLRDSLEGEALDVVTGEDFNPSTYAHFWETLCKNYNNDYGLVNSQLKALLALPKVEKASVAELRKLLNGSTKIVNYLEKLGVEVQTWDVILIYIINGKLDNISKQKWEEIRPKKRFPKFKEFKDWFKERIQSLQTLETNNTEKTELVDKIKSQGLRKKEHSSYQKHIIGQKDMGGVDALLSTAVVEVLDINGDVHMCRILLDNESQSNLITKSLCDKLKLPMEDINILIMGINQVVSNIKRRCSVNICSRHNGFESSVSCLVMDKISEAVPNLNIYTNLKEIVNDNFLPK